MSIRASLAESLGRSIRWTERTVFHKAAGNLPGAIALKAAPDILSHLGKRVESAIVVSATNGKTTTVNLTADCLDAAFPDRTVVCNRDGNNLVGGVITALLAEPRSTSGALACFECDELYTAHVLPQLKPRYFMLLNLFRDQLDRFGEIDRVQQVFADALAKTPETTFVYNGDDPFCASVAAKVPNPTIAFGIAEDLGLEQDRVADSRFCQQCGAPLEYDYVHYGQLGAWRCSECEAARPELAFSARNVRRLDRGFSFDVDVAMGGALATTHVEIPYTGIYMVYNVLAAFTASHLMGCDDASFASALAAFAPDNGRLQRYNLPAADGAAPLIAVSNLAKNPVGFNQNIQMVLTDRARAVAFFVNDQEGDGLDVSWLWDIDFERLADQPGLHVFAGGSRANDVQVRLKYAGIDAQVVEGAEDAAAKMAQALAHEACGGAVQPADSASLPPVYFIANYTALPGVRAELLHLEGGRA